MKDEIVASVRADLLARSNVGAAKYGIPLTRKDLGRRDWLQHAYEEALDMACYLRAIMWHEDNPAAAPQEPADEIGIGMSDRSAPA